ncbi:unnamed protein product [Rhizophagus irregularis]|uniref:Uncharacterized protein n=1 Tax=Rhizophagus irregularis TaxID=588596 RepID=A0A2I1GGB5_9GLOM|nr:hypothetical protein RhiirA4_517557 [Rhizophagus irregularis]CAB4442308.1 unnamed protein product [Rhizophagus irregularis]
MQKYFYNNFSGSGYADIKKPNSYSKCKNIEKARPKVPLEKSQGSVPKKLPDIRISTPPTSQTSKTNQTNASEAQANTSISAKTSVSTESQRDSPHESRLLELNPNEPFIIKNESDIDTLDLHLQQKI